MQAIESSAACGNAVEDTAVILLRFENGVLGTITVSDVIVAPWSWELTTDENPAYPQAGEACYQIGGTHASMTIPYLDVWYNNEERGWCEPIHQERIRVDQADPLALQIRHFCQVIRGEEAPHVSGREGLNTLKVIAAVKQAAEIGQLIHIG